MKYAIVAATIFAGDFFLKEHMEKQQEIQGKTELCKGRVRLKKYHNKGAAMNFLEKSPGLVKKASAAVLLVLAAFWCLFLPRKKNTCLMLGLSLAIGGGASNLYDRVKKGYVMDYFSFRTPWKWLNQIVFNISDLCVIFGSILVILSGKEIIEGECKFVKGRKESGA